MSSKLDWSKAKRAPTVYFRPTGYEEEQARLRRLRREKEDDEWFERKANEDKQLRKLFGRMPTNHPLLKAKKYVR